MLDYIPIIALTSTSGLFFCIGLWLALSDKPMIVNEHTIFNQLFCVMSNKLVGSIYIMGSLLTLAIIWS